jgi:PhnB protein
MAEADRNLVIHVASPILAGHVLMGTDSPETMGFAVTPGNNVYINLEPDTWAETDWSFAALAAGGKVEMALRDMFRGSYFGSLTDRFGVKWMLNRQGKGKRESSEQASGFPLRR